MLEETEQSAAQDLKHFFFFFFCQQSFPAPTHPQPGSLVCLCNFKNGSAIFSATNSFGEYTSKKKAYDFREHDNIL